MTRPEDPQATNSAIVSADTADSAGLAQVIAEAFHDLAVSHWLIPDPQVRREIFPTYFKIFTDHALAAGLVLTTGTRGAAALWLPVSEQGPQLPDGYFERLAKVTGRWLRRFELFDTELEQHHPIGVPHQHLAILAVHPSQQGRGVGTALLNAHHRMLDQDGTAAYLEASGSDTRQLYLKQGYTDHGDPISLPDGPLMHPMWRHPRHTATGKQP